MGRATTRRREHQAFESFRQDFLLPEGRVHYSDKPDVVIEGPRKIGVEITDLHLVDGKNPDSEQVQRRHREAVLARAQALYMEAGGRPIELVVAFAYDTPIRKVEPLAAQLSELGKLVEQGPFGNIPDCRFDHIPELRYVYCSGREYTNARWRTSQSYGVPLLAVSRVEEEVARKTKKAANYQSCDCYWLLIVVDFMDPAQDQDIRWPAAAAPVETHVFERIWLYKPLFREVVEVPIR